MLLQELIIGARVRCVYGSQDSYPRHSQTATIVSVVRYWDNVLSHYRVEWDDGYAFDLKWGELASFELLDSNIVDPKSPSSYQRQAHAMKFL